jgi:RNA polymerase sporulation-specific sigma factor
VKGADVQVLDRPTARAEADDGETADEELVRRTCAGDDAAMLALLGRYRPLVRARARRYYVPGGDRSDVLQEGMIGLYRAVTAFDASREVPFSGFANVCVTRQIRSAVDGARRHKHAVLTDALPLPAPGSPGERTDHRGDPADAVTGDEAAHDLIRFCEAALSSLELEVLSRFLADQTYEAIATALGCGLRSVDNALQRARRKISTHLDARESGS